MSPRVAGASFANTFTSPMVGQSVLYDGEQPTAKQPAPLVIFQPLRGRRHRPQDVLRQIGRIGILQPALSEKPINQWSVQVHKPLPRFLIVSITDAHKQRWLSGWDAVHGNLCRRYAHLLRSYRENERIMLAKIDFSSETQAAS
jgi:hypothetical protein